MYIYVCMYVCLYVYICLHVCMYVCVIFPSAVEAIKGRAGGKVVAEVCNVYKRRWRHLNK